MIFTCLSFRERIISRSECSRVAPTPIITTTTAGGEGRQSSCKSASCPIGTGGSAYSATAAETSSNRRGCESQTITFTCEIVRSGNPATTGDNTDRLGCRAEVALVNLIMINPYRQTVPPSPG